MNPQNENVTVLRFSGPNELTDAAARAWLESLAEMSSENRAFHVGLSGGRVARTFFQAATQLARKRREGLESVEFFWADERCVPPGDPESNFGMANELLFRPLNLAPGRIHRIHGEESPVTEASQAQQELVQIVPANAQGTPVFDLLLLGMGEDGHTASLFPGETSEVIYSREFYRAVKGPKPPPDRITLGYAPIIAARQVWVLVFGGEKAAALRASLQPNSITPLGRIFRQRKSTVVFTDWAAVGEDPGKNLASHPLTLRE